jgi:nicotinamidase-related amidase
MAPELSVRMHDWRIEPREYARQEERRGRRHAFQQLVPSRTVLVVIDMIPFFVSQSAYCRGIVPNVVHLADGLRAAGGLVAWVVPGTEHRHPALAKEFFGDEIAELYRTSAGEGPPASRLWPAFKPHAADLIAEKTAFSAFFPDSCALPALLERQGIDTVLVTGTVTNICCESSARDANAAGFKVVMVADANAARRDQDHNAALHNIYRSFGDVRPTAEVLELLGAGKPANGIRQSSAVDPKSLAK